MIVCKRCGGKNIKQEISMMVDPNSETPFDGVNSHTTVDFFWCDDCDCATTEETIEDETETKFSPLDNLDDPDYEIGMVIAEGQD